MRAKRQEMRQAEGKGPRKKRHKILKEKSERKKTPYKVDLLKLTLVILAIGVAFFLLWDPIRSLLYQTGREALRAKILGLGALAPVVYVSIVILQVLFSVIPGSFVTVFGGYTFGIIQGTILSTIGTVIGSSIAFYLGKRYGRPLLEDIVDPEILGKFDEKSQEKGLVTLLFIFLIPFTPDNAACLVAGATKMRLRSMIIVAAIGRFPGILVATMIGAGISQEFSIWLWMAIGALTVMIALIYYHKKKLESHAYNFIRPNQQEKK